MSKVTNVVHLVGRTGVEPVVRSFRNGMKLAKFSLATNETIIEVNGKKVQTQWHNIVAWGKKAELVEKFIHKGQLMAVEGKLVNRVYHDASGNQKKRTEIQVKEILLINPRQAENKSKVIPITKGSKKRIAANKAS